MDRNLYDLTHLAHISGHIGRIQTVSVIPVEAGSSLEINMDGIARLAPTRKEIVSECRVDIAAFFVPHRIVYGQDWIDFINSGPDSVPPFTGVPIAAPYRNPEYLGLQTCDTEINRALLEGYNRIFYNYYSVPSYRLAADSPSALTTDFDWYPTTENGAENCRKYGRLAARLPHVLNGGAVVDDSSTVGWEAQDLTDADAEVPISGGVLNILDLAQIQSRYKTEAQAAWFAHFYQDIMQERWGTNVSSDADPRNLRPTMLMRSVKMLSGYDIDGTDDATLGTFQGKTLDQIRFQMPRKFFAEHGNVFILQLMRYPLVHTREAHPLLQATNFTYDEIAADPTRIANLAPVGFDPNPWLAGGSSYPVPTNTTMEPVQQPYGQQYRFQPNRIHPNFQYIPGYPFSSWDGVSLRDWYYHQDEEYRQTFQTTQIGQWQTHAMVRAMKYSPVPGVTSSIFAGT